MADNKEKTEDVAEEKKKGGMLKYILMIVGALLISGISVVATMMLMGGDEQTASADNEAAIEDQLKPQDQIVTPEQGEAIYFPFKQPFVINFAAGGRQRYLQLELSVVARDQEAIDAVNLHLPLIRNNLLEKLQQEELEPLRSNDGKVALAERLTKVIQDILMEEIGRPGIQRVLYLKFVMQ